MSSLIKNILRFILLILIQVFVLDKIHLNGYAVPYIYYLFILWLPFNMNRTIQMLLAFIIGFTLDSFRHNPGFHAAACVFIAYIRPFVINILTPQQEGAENNHDEPSAKSMGGLTTYMVYAGILTLLHNAWLFLLEAWQIGDLVYFISKTIFSSIISLALIFIAELLFVRKHRYRF